MNETRYVKVILDENGNGVGEFPSIPFKVRKIKTISGAFQDDGGTPLEGFFKVDCDLYNRNPVIIINGAETSVSRGGSFVEFNPPRDIQPQPVNFRMTTLEGTSPTITAGSPLGLILEFEGVNC